MTIDSKIHGLVPSRECCWDYQTQPEFLLEFWALLWLDWSYKYNEVILHSPFLEKYSLVSTFTNLSELKHQQNMKFDVILSPGMMCFKVRSCCLVHHWIGTLVWNFLFHRWESSRLKDEMQWVGRTQSRLEPKISMFGSSNQNELPLAHGAAVKAVDHLEPNVNQKFIFLDGVRLLYKDNAIISLSYSDNR